MINRNELTAEEIYELKMIALEKKKERMEKEIAELKKQGYSDKETISAMAEYFKN